MLREPTPGVSKLTCFHQRMAVIYMLFFHSVSICWYDDEGRKQEPIKRHKHQASRLGTRCKPFYVNWKKLHLDYMFVSSSPTLPDIDGLVQDCSNSNVLAMQLMQSSPFRDGSILISLIPRGTSRPAALVIAISHMFCNTPSPSVCFTNHTQAVNFQTFLMFTQN